MNKKELIEQVALGMYSGNDGSDGSSIYCLYAADILCGLRRDLRKLPKKQLLDKLKEMEDQK